MSRAHFPLPLSLCGFIRARRQITGGKLSRKYVASSAFTHVALSGYFRGEKAQFCCLAVNGMVKPPRLDMIECRNCTIVTFFHFRRINLNKYSCIRSFFRVLKTECSNIYLPGMYHACEDNS